MGLARLPEGQDRFFFNSLLGDPRFTRALSLSCKEGTTNPLVINTLTVDLVVALMHNGIRTCSAHQQHGVPLTAAASLDSTTRASVLSGSTGRTLCFPTYLLSSLTSVCFP